MEKNVLIAMSGGVDSTVAAKLLIGEGHECAGMLMELQEGSEEQIRQTHLLCDQLGIMFCLFDLKNKFRELVQEPFVRDYEAGLTPNPCIRCNTHLKFAEFWRNAKYLGCTHMATGHYARIVEDNGRFYLKKARDARKDQSYFLYGIPRELLAHVLFPLGELDKATVRRLAEESGLLSAHKKDSQDICFIPDGDYMRFLKEFRGKDYAPGAFLDQDGRVVGTHCGAVAYTLGQRKGLGIALGEPVYVCAKDMAANTVTVGPNEALFHSSLRAVEWNWLVSPAPTAPLRCKAKARSRMEEQPATVYPEENGSFRVEFDAPQRALTPGQAVVLYEGDTVLGGGTIAEVL